jgi:hypothetical protein
MAARKGAWDGTSPSVTASSFPPPPTALHGVSVLGSVATTSEDLLDESCRLSAELQRRYKGHPDVSFSPAK